ncbi:MAG: xanthine dehydrogenase family protein subunit M [SAR324 cluster bacterium]|nr:xanthine dehydrogenase family protein subunit M [SAR324 cluster bacterium]
MLRLPPFEYLKPETLAHALEMKLRYGEDAMFTAGGTDLYPNMKRRQFEPRFLIALTGIQEMKQIEMNQGMRIGAGVSLDSVASHSLIQTNYPALATAAGHVSSPQLRKMGTLGGNLCVDTRCTYYNQNYPWRKSLGFCMKKDGDVCWVARSSPKCLAVSSSDCAPVMIALDAEFTLFGNDGERTIKAEEFYQDDGIHYLNKNPDEILISVFLPNRTGWGSVYKKLRRRGTIDFPVLGTAAAARLDEEGICVEARLALGAVASAPVLASKAAEMLMGKRPEPELIESASQEASKLAKPMDNTDMNLSYRKKMVSVFVSRALKDAIGIQG